MQHSSSVTTLAPLADARHASWAAPRGAPLAEQQLNVQDHSFSPSSKPVATTWPRAPPTADKHPRFSLSQELPARPVVPLPPMQERPVKRAHSAPVVRWWSRGMQVAVHIIAADTSEAARPAAPSLSGRAAIEKRGHKRSFSTSSERSRPPVASGSRATSAPSSGHGPPVVSRRSPAVAARHLVVPTSTIASDDARPSQLRRTQLLVRRGADLVPAGPRSGVVVQRCPHERGGRCPLRLCRARQPPSAAPSQPSSPVLHSTQPDDVVMSQPRPA